MLDQCSSRLVGCLGVADAEDRLVRWRSSLGNQLNGAGAISVGASCFVVDEIAGA
jgi:hypothetical protein